MVSLRHFLRLHRNKDNYYPVHASSFASTVEEPTTSRSTRYNSLRAIMTALSPSRQSTQRTIPPMQAVNISENFPQEHRRMQTIGTGSESTVELWSHRASGKLLAVKMLRPRIAMPHVNRIPNEVHILKDLPLHDHIVRLEAYYAPSAGLRQGCVLYEHLPAGDLFSLRELSYRDGHRGSFSEGFMWSVFTQLSSALSFLHEGVGSHSVYWRPIVHRDIKLENVFVKTAGTKSDGSDVVIKLGDFGLAAFYSQVTHRIQLDIGTPDFWPPETTYWDRVYGPEADVWEIGSVMHELAHGFPAVEDADMYIAIAQLPEHRGRFLHPHWNFLSPAMRRWYLTIQTPRLVLPVNLEVNDQRADRRRIRACPKYSDRLNACLLMALTTDRKDRPIATELKDELEEASAQFMFEELGREHQEFLQEDHDGHEDGSEYEAAGDVFI